jgi:hypothetical protein
MKQALYVLGLAVCGRLKRGPCDALELAFQGTVRSGLHITEQLRSLSKDGAAEQREAL